MSEADNPNQENGLPESNEFVDVTAPIIDLQASGSAAAKASDEGWETVDFPGAISVEAIPQQGSLELAPDADPEVVSALASLSESPLVDSSTPAQPQITPQITPQMKPTAEEGEPVA
ncbi:MAG: hypothetical protein WCA35_00130, partial [Kovacikia sp.]